MDAKSLAPSGWAALAGVVLGATLALVTAWMSTSGPSGEGWSFRGNGALVVPLGFGAAALSGGWVALALYARGFAAWLALGAAAGAAAAGPAALSILVLMLFGSAAQSTSDLLTIPSFASPVLSLAIALFVRPSRAQRSPAAAAAFAGAVFAAALVAGFLGAQMLLPS